VLWLFNLLPSFRTKQTVAWQQWHHVRKLAGGFCAVTIWQGNADLQQSTYKPNTIPLCHQAIQLDN